MLRVIPGSVKTNLALDIELSCISPFKKLTLAALSTAGRVGCMDEDVRERKLGPLAARIAVSNARLREKHFCSSRFAGTAMANLQQMSVQASKSKA